MKVRGSYNSFNSQVIFPCDSFKNIKSHAFLVGWNLEHFRCLVCSNRIFFIYIFYVLLILFSIVVIITNYK